MKLRVGILLTCAASGLLAAQAAPGEPNPLLRQYRDGERLTYQMKGTNEAWHYQVQAEGVVKRDPDGTYFEEYGWSHLVSDDQETALSADSISFRQQVTLDPNRGPVFPNLSQVDSGLVGPMTDFLTFYVDLWLAAKTGQITHPGDHFYFKRGTPSSWADGGRVLIGESSVDFDLTLKNVNPTDRIATVVIKHLPPEKPEIRLPVGWMRKPVADTANNWVQLQKTKDNQYLAAVGKETFDVQITLSLADGKILFATMDNRVEALERECADSALEKCSDARPHLIERRIEIKAISEGTWRLRVMKAKPNSANAEGVFEPFPITEVPWQEFSHGERFGMRFQHLSSYAGGTQIGIANEVLAPGKQANPLHYHMLEEEHVFVLEGSLTVRLGEKTYILSAGHYVCFPAGQKVGHALFNHTSEPCRYLIIGNPSPHEVAVFPETGRVDVKLMGEGYRRSAAMDYWDDIDAGDKV